MEEHTMTSFHHSKTCMENINWLWQAEKDALAFVVTAIPIHGRLFIRIYFGCNFVSDVKDFAWFLRFFFICIYFLLVSNNRFEISLTLCRQNDHL